MDAQREARRLVDTYTPMLMRIGYTYLRSKEDAEDVCQETLMKLVRRGAPFECEEHERAWVVRVAINACKSLARSAARRRVVDLDEAGEVAVEDRAEEGEALAAVQDLPETYRVPVFLHYGEGYKISEIAAMTGKTRGAVAKNLQRGREMLRKALGVDFR